MTIQEILDSTNYSAVTKNCPAYKKSYRKFSKNALAMDYEKKRKKKKKKLKEATVPEIFSSVKKKEIDYDKALNMLAKMKNARAVLDAAKFWPNFNFKKGFEALIKADERGKPIYLAGLDWPKFDYERALDALAKVDDSGQYIYWAGRDWPKFNYVKGLESLKGTEYYNDALRDWPKGSKETAKIIKELKQKAKKLPKKKLKL